MFLAPSSGTGKFAARAKKSIRLVRVGCANRPFYHISVTHTFRSTTDPVIEQLGSYDPMPNAFNEKLVALNFERIKFWMGKGAHLSPPVSELLGLAGFLPIHPKTYMNAWRNRRTQRETQQKEAEELAKKESGESEKNVST